MPELRRLGIAAGDPGRLAAFYREVFDLEAIGEENGTILRSDGTFNLAIAAAITSTFHEHGFSVF